MFQRKGMSHGVNVANMQASVQVESNEEQEEVKWESPACSLRGSSDEDQAIGW